MLDQVRIPKSTICRWDELYREALKALAVHCGRRLSQSPPAATGMVACKDGFVLMEQEELFRRLAVALAIGLLIGLERGWRTRDETDATRTAGLRTFALTGLLGGISGAISAISSPLVLAFSLLAFSVAFVVFSYLEATAERNFSVTGVVAGILTFMLGAYAMLGNQTVAVAAAVAMAILLALREPLHAWVRTLTCPEMRSALTLLAMSFLLLPILPNRPVDPWNIINPSEIWLLAILVAAVSFGGYIAVRVLGERKGIAMAAIAGGVASSTATTLSLARIAREYPESWRLLAGGILLSGLTMFVRIVVVAGALNPGLIERLVWPAASAGLVLLISSVLLLLGGRAQNAEGPALELKNPFDLATVLKLAALIAAIMLIVKPISDIVGKNGLLLLAGVSGIVDVDALTLSMSRLAGAQVETGNAVAAILMAAGVNTVSKTAIAAYVGGWRVGRVVGFVSLLALIALVATFAATHG